jgi:hypothetical protein
MGPTLYHLQINNGNFTDTVDTGEDTVNDQKERGHERQQFVVFSFFFIEKGDMEKMIPNVPMLVTPECVLSLPTWA